MYGPHKYITRRTAKDQSKVADLLKDGVGKVEILPTRHHMGETVKKKVSERVVSFRLTYEDYTTLEELAKIHKTTISQMVRILIRKSVDKPVDPGYNPKGLTA